MPQVLTTPERAHTPAPALAPLPTLEQASELARTVANPQILEGESVEQFLSRIDTALTQTLQLLDICNAHGEQLTKDMSDLDNVPDEQLHALKDRALNFVAVQRTLHQAINTLDQKGTEAATQR